jgi:hypothetical protein
MNENRFLFRIWDKERNEMIYPDTHEHRDWVKDALWGNDEWSESVILMQCTGLTEYRNPGKPPWHEYGKDIYEGDFIEFTDEPGRVYEVDWVMGGFHAIPIDQSTSSSSESWKGVGHTDNRVLGNKYQNPELVEIGQKYDGFNNNRRWSDLY